MISKLGIGSGVGSTTTPTRADTRTYRAAYGQPKINKPAKKRPGEDPVTVGAGVDLVLGLAVAVVGGKVAHQGGSVGKCHLAVAAGDGTLALVDHLDVIPERGFG